MMKITSIILHIEDPDAPGTRRCTYDAESGLWAVEGQVYARHLKALAEITNILRQTDSSKGQKE